MDNVKYNKYSTRSTTKMIGSDRTAVNINSNFLMTFNIINSLPLPSNSKIKIEEVNLNYDIYESKKNILLNGHKIESDLNSLNESFYLKGEYFNLTNEENSKIILSLVESIRLNMSINLKLKGFAYIDGCEPIFIEVHGKSKDCIEAILVAKNNIYNYKNILRNVKIYLENNLTPIVNPDFIFLSPIYDEHLDIYAFIGNVYISFGLGLHMVTCLPISKHSCKTRNYYSEYEI